MSDQQERDVSHSERIDEFASRFEIEWRASKSPRIEDYLEEAGNIPLARLFQELLLVELDLRRADGQRPDFEEYRSRFPEFSDIAAPCFAIKPESTTTGVSETITLPKAVKWRLNAQSLRTKIEQFLSHRYEIVNVVGCGAMGCVFRALHKELGMPVAIKVMQPGESSERFRREANILAQIRSPHVVSVHDYEVLPDETPVLVMDWIEGSDMSQRIKATDGPLNEELCLQWMKETCDGMLATSAQGIIHRDLKPSNILIDNNETARVADFGLASTSQELAQSGVAGTPYYMSPEQAEDPQNVDTRSDIYGFGATFYHALTGRPPFQAPTPSAVLVKHKMEPLRSASSHNRSLLPSINDILERCLAKSPSDRFQSFGEIRKFLDSLSHISLWDGVQDEQICEMLKNYNDRKTDYLQPTKRASDICHEYVFPNGRKLRIVTGSIVDQQADAIVNSIGSRLDMSKGVSRAVREGAGEQVEQELLRYKIVKPGRVVATSAGNLSARFIFHGSTLGYSPDGLVVPSRDVIAELVSNIFHLAETLYVASLAMPLLGTGAGGLSRDTCLDVLFRSIAQRLYRGMTLVKEVTIVVYQHGEEPRESKLPPQVPLERKLESIARFSATVSSGMPFDDLAQQALSTLLGSFNQSNCGIIGLVKSSGSIIPRWTRTRDPLSEAVPAVSPDRLKRVIDAGHSMRFLDLPAQTEKEGRHKSWPAVMCAPLMTTDGKVIGFIQVEATSPQAGFNDEDLNLLTTVAGQVAVALENARLHELSLQSQQHQRDLELASEVQHSFLPRTRPSFPGFEFYDFYQPSSHLGGDYFDYVQLPDGGLAVVIGDVVGHGTGAAITMAKLSSEVRFALQSGSDIAKSLGLINDRFIAFGADHFATMVVIVLRANSDEVAIVNAGHMSPVFRRQDGYVFESAAEGLPLGVLDGFEYKANFVEMRTGECLLMYTDGLNECSSPEGEPYGIPSIRDQMRQPATSASELGDRIQEDALRFIGEGQLEDDMTLVCIRRT